MADTFLTHLDIDKCNWGTIKSLKIKIVLWCELFQNRFYFKDELGKLSSWSVKSFWFHCIINAKFFDELTLFICHLFRLYKKKCLKRVRDDIKTIFKNTKNNKIYEFTENRIK